MTQVATFNYVCLECRLRLSSKLPTSPTVRHTAFRSFSSPALSKQRKRPLQLQAPTIKTRSGQSSHFSSQTYLKDKAPRGSDVRRGPRLVGQETVSGYDAKTKTVKATTADEPLKKDESGVEMIQEVPDNIKSLEEGYKEQGLSDGRGSRHLASVEELGEDLFEEEIPDAEYELPADTSTSVTPERAAAIARSMFGDRLPEGLLSDEQYKVYERLYGEPIKVAKFEVTRENEPDALFRESGDGSLEEVEFTPAHELHELETKFAQYEPGETAEETTVQVAEDIMGEVEEGLPRERPSTRAIQEQRAKEQRTRVQEQLERDIAEAMALQAASRGEELAEDGFAEPEEDAEYGDRPQINGEDMRAHPFTVPNRFGTSPSTVSLPIDDFIRPASAILAEKSNKHLHEFASKTFGGPGLPYATGTPVSSRVMPQKPIPLTAEQAKMKDTEADIWLAALMPGQYAAITSILVEVRKRMGTEWIEQLLSKEGGARILDAGAGGAGVFAWRDVVKAEWKRMHDGAEEDGGPPAPLGKATVLTGSDSLRQRASFLLENTTFIPRLPDYVHANLPDEDHRKQFDMIIAPYTLWHPQETFERKQKILNLWSLLNPKGGILVLMEKGVPRGFEVIAAAREYLIERLFERPTSAAPFLEETEEFVDEMDLNASRDALNSARTSADAHTQHRLPYLRRTPARIIAPCPHHSACPMYLPHSGESRQRKDYCHFSQRYLRPPFYQRLLKAKERNHEDVHFSYVAVQKGVKMPDDILQGEEADARAFEGYDVYDADVRFNSPTANSVEDGVVQPPRSPLPRAVLPPIKRPGHVMLDVCTPAGAFERWTVPRSYGRVPYRDARKARWGDLWALGAKLRVPKSVRLRKNKFDLDEDGVPAKSTKDVKGRVVKGSSTGKDSHFDKSSSSADAELRKRQKAAKKRELKMQKAEKFRERARQRRESEIIRGRVSL